MYLSPGGFRAGEAGVPRAARALIDVLAPEPIDCITRLAAKWLEATSR